MKPVLIAAVLILFAWCNINGQAPVKKKKPYIASVEMLSGEKKYGILHDVDSNELHLLPHKKVRFAYLRRQAIAEEDIPFSLASQQIRSLSIHRKGATAEAVGIGMVVGLTAGSLIGAITTKKNTCPPNSGLCQSLNGLDRISNSAEGMVIGIGVGSLAGLLIGEGRKKRFIINGDRRRYYDVQRTLTNNNHYPYLENNGKGL